MLVAQLDLWASLPLALAGFARFETRWWLGALVSELRLPLALFLACLAVLYGARRRVQRAAASITAACALALPLWPLIRPARLTPAYGPQLRVAQIDLEGAALPHARLAAWLRQSDADVISLTRLSAHNDGFAEPFSQHVVAPGESPAARLLVRQTLAPQARSAGVLRLQLASCFVHIRQISLPSRLALRARATRARHIQALIESKLHPRSVYVGWFGSQSAAGDLAPWLLHHGLRDTRLGHGYLATSPGVAGSLGLPLSSILVHGWIAARDAAIGAPIVRGAARTLHATLELTEPRCRL